jgi:hypothetical protein
MPEAANIEAGLVAFLKADIATNALTAGRIFGGELPAAETASMPRQAIVIKASGGAQLLGDTFVEKDTQRVDLFAFAATPSAAGSVMRTAALALRTLRRGVYGGVLIEWANTASGSLSGREPVTEWPRQFQSFQVMHGLFAVE